MIKGAYYIENIGGLKLANGWFFAKSPNVRTLQSFPPYGTPTMMQL